MLLIRLILLPVTLSLLAVRIVVRIVRILGIRRLTVFGVGVGVGMLAAPTTGAELRARLRKELEARRAPGDADLADRVRAELSQSPRTWHLPQPTVEVVNGTAVLRGSVPHDAGRTDLERAARAVAGVAAVDNHLQVTPLQDAPAPAGAGRAPAGADAGDPTPDGTPPANPSPS